MSDSMRIRDGSTDAPSREDNWVPVRTAEPPPSAVQDLQKQCANLALAIAALTERLERLEGGGSGDTSEELEQRRAAILSDAPYRAASYDRESILAHGGRRIAGVYTAEDRPFIVQALNDAADAAKRRQR